MQIRAHHWGWAVGGAVFLHGAVAAALLWTPAPAGARLPGIGGIEVSLGPAGGAPGAEAADVAPAQAVKAAEAVETPPAETPVPIETPEETAVAEPVVAEPVIPDTVAIEPVKAVPPPREPLPLPPRRPEAKAPPPKPVEAPAKPAPPPPVKVATADPGPVPTQSAAVPSMAGSQGKAGTKNAKGTGSGDGSMGGGAAGAAADYMSVLQAWLERHKEYPAAARRSRTEGAVLLYFAIDRHGKLLDYRVEKTSGHPLLDREALAMIRRADPLPGIPDDMHRDRLEIVVPVQFTLR